MKKFKLSIAILAFSSIFSLHAEEGEIHQLIQERKTNELESLLEESKNLNIEIQNEYGETPLMSTAKPCSKNECNDYANIAKILINNHADINFKDKNEYTTLSKAAQNGNYALVKTLLESGANPNIPGYSPLIEAASLCKEEDNCDDSIPIIDLLLKYHANLNITDPSGDTVISAAVDAGNFPLIKKLEKYPITEQEFSKKSEILFESLLEDVQFAASYNSKSKGLIAEILVRHIKNINKTGDNGTLLYKTVRVWGAEKFLKIAKALLKSGANPNIPTTDGDTPLRVASKSGYINMVKLLIKNGAKISHTGNSVTNIWSAACEENTDIVKLLIKSGADINEKNLDNGQTALDCAKESDFSELVKLLIKNGAH